MGDKREGDTSLQPIGIYQRSTVKQFSMFRGSTGLLRTVGYLACERFSVSDGGLSGKNNTEMPEARWGIRLPDERSNVLGIWCYLLPYLVYRFLDVHRSDDVGH